MLRDFLLRRNDFQSCDGFLANEAPPKLTPQETHSYNASVRIGLLGGTFDPIHHGHLFIAEEARVRCGLDKVIFFPNHTPAHWQGKRAEADGEVRFELTRLAVVGQDGFEVSRVELDRPGPSYAIETLEELQRQMPGAELFFIVGADTLGELPTWHRAAELFENCQFIALSRPGENLQAAGVALTEAQRARVILLESVLLEISSSEVRRRVRAGLPVRFLLPEAVEGEIRRRGLYLHD